MNAIECSRSQRQNIDGPEKALVGTTSKNEFDMLSNIVEYLFDYDGVCERLCGLSEGAPPAAHRKREFGINTNGI